MADNEIRTDVDTSIKVQTSGQDDINKMSQALNDFSDSLNNIKGQISTLGNLDISRNLPEATSAINTLKQSLDYLIDSAFTFYEKGFINENQLESMTGVLQNYISTVNEYSASIKEASDNSDRMKKILELSDAAGSGELGRRLRESSEQKYKLNEKTDNSESIAAIEKVNKEFDQFVENGGWEKYYGTLKDVDTAQDEVVDGLQDGGNALNNTNLNLEDLEGTLLNMVKSGKLSSASIEGLLSTLGMAAPEIAAVVAAFTILAKVFSEISKATDEVIDGFKGVSIQTAKFLGDIATGSIDLFVDGLGAIADAFKDIANFCGDCIEQIREFADIGSDVQDSYFRIYEYLGADAGSNIINYTKNLSELTNTDFKEMITGMKGVLAVTSQLGLDADGVTKYSKALNNMALDLSVFSGESIENIASQYENAINLGVLNSRSAIAKAFDLTDSDIKQFKSLNTELERTNFLLQRGESIQGLYNQYMDTAAGKVNQLKNAWTNFNSTVGQLALQLYAIVAPVLTKLINLATYAVNVLAKLLHIDLGTNNNGLASAFSNNMADNVGRYADNVGKVGDSIEETGKKAKAASRKVASFDDVIQINEDKSSDSKTSGLTDDIKDLQNYDPSSWLGEFGDALDDVTDYSLPNLKNMIQDLLDDFKSWEESLDWSKIREEARNLGKDLAEVANVIARDTQAWKDFGNLLGNGVNVGLEFLDGFAKEFDFSALGTSIVTAWNEFWDTIDTGLAAETMADWFEGILDTFINIFAGEPLTHMFDKLSRIIAGFFIRITDGPGLGKIRKGITLFINDALDAINTALDNFDVFNTGEKIVQVVGAIFKQLGAKFPEIIATLSRLIVAGLNLLGDSISTAINSFFEGFDKKEDGVNTIIDSIINVVSAVFNNIGKIGEAIASHKDQIIELIKGLIDQVLANSNEWGSQLAPIVDTIIEVLNSLDWEKIDAAIIGFLSSSHLPDLVETWIYTKFQSLIAGLVAKITVGGGTILKAIMVVINLISGNILGALTLLFGEQIGAVLADFGKTISDWWSGVEAYWDGVFTKLDEDTAEGREALNTFFTDLDKNWNAWITDEKRKWKEGFLDAWNGIKNGILNIVNGIKGAFDSLGKSIENIISKIKSLWNSTIGGKSFALPQFMGGGTFSIPRLATGAIVSGSTLANIGEDGTEAVLPLEKNTGWMDALATRLAEKINAGGGSASAPVEIKLSNKNFYTRSEMLDFAEQVVQALRIYGVNVSVAY